MPWSGAFDNPILLPGHGEQVTLRDAGSRCATASRASLC
jgi:hypothetical protein